MVNIMIDFLREIDRQQAQIIKIDYFLSRLSVVNLNEKSMLEMCFEVKGK